MSLTLYSGTLERRFNQGTHMANWISSSGMPGLCYGLSCYWIACRANGLDFWTLMMDSNGRVRDSAARTVVKLQEDLVGRDRANETVRTFTDDWFAKQDVRVAGYKFASDSGPGISTNLGGRSCGHAMTSSDREYSLIHILPGNSHAMASWKSPDKKCLRFFDPNSGEVCFNNHGNFVDYVTSYWFKMSYFVNTDWHCYGYCA